MQSQGEPAVSRAQNHAGPASIEIEMPYRISLLQCTPVHSEYSAWIVSVAKFRKCSAGLAPRGRQTLAGGASPRIGYCIKPSPGRGDSRCMAIAFCRRFGALHRYFESTPGCASLARVYLLWALSATISERRMIRPLRRSFLPARGFLCHRRSI